ncbi:MAG: hypothetical protein EZS28_022071 [Streblomastix strix]|uniref:Uncharacterized protein n=1 Tax=Streblomastix strix TaxID=222440 RepID=A0A5J4VJG4_9EUKA|nr:MAG: hypothetical protein EZS28_022071 [Streblomastix strix]
MTSGTGNDAASIPAANLTSTGYPKNQFYYFNTITSSAGIQNARWSISTSSVIDIKIMSSESGNPGQYATTSRTSFTSITNTNRRIISAIAASSGSDPQLIVYGDRVTLTVLYETSGLFPNGYLFKSYPEEARPKAGDKVIALVGTDTTIKNSIFCYIDQNGPFIINTSQIPSKIALVIIVTYYKKYLLSKMINYDAINDGIVSIMNTWFVNGKETFIAQYHVDIKLMGELGIYKANRAAFFTKEALEVAVNGVLNKYDCELQGTYILDNYWNPPSNEESNQDSNALPSDPKKLDSHIDEGSYANNTFYTFDDGTCKVCVFNLYFETKGQATSTQETGRTPGVILPAEGKTGIFNKLKKLVQIIGKRISWMNVKIVKPIMPITNALLQSLGSSGSMVAKGISVGSSAVDALFGPKKQ